MMVVVVSIPPGKHEGLSVYCADSKAATDKIKQGKNKKVRNWGKEQNKIEAWRRHCLQASTLAMQLKMTAISRTQDTNFCNSNTRLQDKKNAVILLIASPSLQYHFCYKLIQSIRDLIFYHVLQAINLINTYICHISVLKMYISYTVISSFAICKPVFFVPDSAFNFVFYFTLMCFDYAILYNAIISHY